MGIGKTLSDILTMQKRNPNELAEKIGESPSTIYSIIRRDNMKVDIAVLGKICEELNIPMEQFYNDYVVHTFKHNLSLSGHEEQVILAYRQNPSMQSAVDKLLGVEAAAEEQKRA